MGKLVRRFLLGDLWDFGKHESWFSDMALKGLHLQSIGNWFALFEKGHPQKIKYRIEILEKSPSDEQLELYSECGWDLVANKQMFYVFSSPEELNAPELQTDPMEQGFTFKVIDKQLKINVVSIFIIFLSFSFPLLFQLFFQDEPYLYLIERIAFVQIIVLIPYMYVFFNLIRGYFSVKKMKDSLLMGIPINHRSNWKPAYMISSVIHIYLIALMALLFISPFCTAIRRDLYAYKAVADTPVISIYDIEKGPVYDYSHFIDYDWSMISPVQYIIYEDGYIDGEMQDDFSGAFFKTGIQTRYYELTIKILSEGLLNDLVHRYYRQYNFEEKLTEIKNTKFDRLYAASGKENKLIFASFDNKVIYIKYSGNTDIDYIISMIEKKHNL